MKLEQSFTVTAPVEQVWAALVDVERVAPCLPGAEITGQTPEGGYEGTFTVKLGPTTAAYRGSLKMESLDEERRLATMSARGTDKRGQGGATATIVSSLRDVGGDTTVDVATDFTITGRLARFGRSGMIEDISKRLMRDFAACLQSRLGAEHPPASSAAAAASGEAGAQPTAQAVEGPPLAGTAASEDAQASAAVASAGGAAAEAQAAGEVPLEAGAASTGPTGPEPGAQPPRAASTTPPTSAARPAPAPAKPVKVLSLFASVMGERIKRFWQRIKRLFARGRKTSASN